MATPKLIFGAGLLNKDHGFDSAEDVKPWLEVLLESKKLVSEVDTSILYRQSEEYLGQLKFGSHFAIATKLPGESKPDELATKETVIAQAKGSLRRLCVYQVFCCLSTGMRARSSVG
jgi:hypothetical protein